MTLAAWDMAPFASTMRLLPMDWPLPKGSQVLPSAVHSTLQPRTFCPAVWSKAYNKKMAVSADSPLLWTHGHFG